MTVDDVHRSLGTDADYIKTQSPPAATTLVQMLLAA
jgi:hypothetical protein